MKSFTLILLILISSSSYCQEICNNGVDDDADGLVDLNDTDCQCDLGLNIQLSDAIPNPNFDSTSCCPPPFEIPNWSNLQHTMNCLDGWFCSAQINHYNTLEAVSYLNTCNECLTQSNMFLPPTFNLPSECFSSIDNGFLSLAFDAQFHTNWYALDHVASTCLHHALTSANNYRLEMDVYNFSRNNPNQPPVLSDMFEMSILADGTCANVPLTGFSCNLINWQTVGHSTTSVARDSAWHQLDFTFTPSTPINALSIGETCGSIFSSSLEGNQTRGRRLIIDSLKLWYSKIYDLQITETGSWCSFPYKLNASIDTVGGTWQWYKDSVAIVGATDTILDITNLGLGNYTIVYSLNGSCQGFNLEIGPPVFPLSFLTPLNLPICQYDSIYFDGFSFISPGSVDFYYFDFGNGDSAFVEDPVYAYNQPGVYNIIRTAESDRGCQTTDTTVITVHEAPNVDFIFNNICLYDSANFNAISTINNGTIDSTWWLIDNTFYHNMSSVKHQFQSFGIQPITLFAQSSIGCKQSTVKDIVINPAPSASFTAENNCENTAINFDNSSTIGSGIISEYLWLFGDGNTDTVQNSVHSFMDAGNYLSVLITKSDSGCTDTAQLAIEIYPNPVANFTPYTNCFVTEFENNSTIASGFIETFEWEFGDGQSATISEPNYKYNSEGLFIASLHITSDMGCMSDTSFEIQILNNLEADFEFENALICANTNVLITDRSTPNSLPNTSYYWALSDGQESNQKNPTFQFTSTSTNNQTIDIFYHVSTATGCADSILMHDAFTIVPAPSAFFTFSPEKPELLEPEVKFKNLSTLATHYEWNFGDNNYSNETNPIHSYIPEAKTYTVRLIATDANNTCFDEHSEILVVQDEILFFIPNTFTPDGTGKNNLFKPIFVSGIDIYKFRFQVFNRWGELVFESFDPEGYWNGEYAGQIAQEGVYVWKLDFTESMVDKTHTHSGTITLLK